MFLSAKRLFFFFRNRGWLGRTCPLLTVSPSLHVFERRTSTGSGLFALFRGDFDQILGQIVSLRVKTLRNTNLIASRQIKIEKVSLPVYVPRSETSLLTLPNTNVKLGLFCS